MRLNATHNFILKIPNKKDLASNRSSAIDFKDFMKLYKDYTKEPHSFSVNDTTLSSDNPLQFRKNGLRKTIISEKIKAVNNKIEQNETQYNLDRQTAKISALSTWNFSKYEFFTNKDVLPEKELIEEAAAIKKFGKELKKHASFAEKHYQKFRI